MNYSFLVSNTILALKYFKKYPADYLRLLLMEEKDLFVNEWSRLCEQMERGLTEGSVFEINRLIHNYPELRKQFLGKLSIDEIRKAAYQSNDLAKKENLRLLLNISREAIAIRDILVRINGEINEVHS